MRRNGSFLWILFLLAALFAGPTVILKTTRQPQSLKPLRMSVDSERLIDAPRSLKDGELRRSPYEE
ncbi:MAG: hypothetical protein AUJ52_10135 [Elusimicrobia bacterium CG1_02_63_36]|nr:MAG: hypothetical protein AUJ52_10135 [Elusimicrobia bacterium CG1_02_63_36]PIP82722.1 MAG: hypothetical protein COR54_13270 [Elusimicrobia bacterium CG22_combo_CG10-13_8_21_14_all_63_91]PJA11965.1 MAG: hypothetical protein COX66_18455 [Elusimicrobia bacterium CG_4_10_14_0_2_um_filter_63_34]PJB23790.1 MAG: hypothetical protein CO113_16885 [Elusimicrobia bacterium CG_4_9_14_3_um_filter_62_55]